MALKGAGYRFVESQLHKKDVVTKAERKKIFQIVDLAGAVYYRTLLGRPSLKKGNVREDLMLIKKKIGELGI